MNMHSKLLNNHSVHPPLSAGEVNLQPNFQKGGRFTEPQPLEGICWERGGDFFFFGGGLQFSHKNKSKYQNLNI